jgi:hypothetical protein
VKLKKSMEEELLIKCLQELLKMHEVCVIWLCVVLVLCFAVRVTRADRKARDLLPTITSYVSPTLHELTMLNIAVNDTVIDPPLSELRPKSSLSSVYLSICLHSTSNHSTLLSDNTVLYISVDQLGHISADHSRGRTILRRAEVCFAFLFYFSRALLLKSLLLCFVSWWFLGMTRNKLY